MELNDDCSCPAPGDGDLVINLDETQEEASSPSAHAQRPQEAQIAAESVEQRPNTSSSDVDIEIEYNPLYSAPGGVPGNTLSATTEKDALFKCNMCAYQTDDGTYLSVHKKTHLFKFNCDACYYVCGSYQKLLHHQKKRHMDVEDLLIYCGDCQFTTLVRKEMRDHRRQEHKKEPISKERGISCPSCPFKSVRRTTLVRHQAKVHNEAMFECRVCSRAFAFELEHDEHFLCHKYDFDLRRYGVRRCKRCTFSTKDEVEIINHHKTVHQASHKHN